MTQHSAAFRLIRDLLLKLEDGDRRRLADLFGAMNEPKPDPSSDLLALLEAFAQLDRGDQVRLARWVRIYVNRWGQVPQAPSRLHPAHVPRASDARADGH